jgi:hypothetical protein
MRFEVISRGDLAWPESASPFASRGFFDAWCSAFDGGFVLAGFRGDVPALVLPMFARGDKWYGLGELRADYTEVAGNDVDELWSWLANEAPCRAVKLSRMRRDSVLGRSAPPPNRVLERIVDAGTSFVRTRGRARYHETHEAAEHPYADRAHVEKLAERIDSKDTKRKLNVLRKSGELTYEVVRGPAVAPLLPAFFEMHRAEFAGTGRTSQFVHANERRFYEALVERVGTVAMDVLSAGEQRVAMHFGFEQAGTIYWYKPAFDLAHAKGSPGRVMLAHLFARAARDGVACVDLLKGDEAYKNDWANHRRVTLTTTIVEHRLRDVLGVVTRRLRHLTRRANSESLPRS